MLNKLIIRNYIPLLKKGIKSIELNTEHILNFLLGRNGYGKSSLLKEMSPLPPDNAKYEDKGYKEIHYTINNKTFILISETGKKSKHQFIVDGVNQNEGNTLAEQKALVRQYFGLTNEIKNILTGLDVTDRLSSLSPERRKQFFMSVNPNDTTVAYKKFEKVKIAHNQTKGALKHQRNRLNSEYVRQVELANMNIDEMKARISQLDIWVKNALIAHGELLNVKDPNIDVIKKEMNTIMLDMLEFDYAQLHLTEGQYLELIKGNEKQITYLEHKVSVITDRIKMMVEKINNFDLPEGFGLKGYELKLEELTKQVAYIEKERNILLEFIHKDSFFDNHLCFEDSVVYSLAELEMLLLNVEVTPDKQITATIFTALQKDLENIRKDINNTNREIEKRLHLIKHYENSDFVNCPKCEHQFKIGFENKDIGKIKEELAYYQESYKTQKSKEEYINDQITINDGWYVTMKSLMRFIRPLAHCDYFTSMIKEHNVGKEDVSLLVNRLKAIRDVVSFNRELETLISRQTTLSAQYKLYNECDIDKLFLDVEKLNEELSYTERELAHYKQLFIFNNEKLDQIKSNGLIKERFLILLDELNEALIEKGKYQVKDNISKAISLMTTDKDELVNKLILSESMTAIIIDLEKSVAELEKKEEHLKILMDALSPTKGFIGYLMAEFNNTVVANINAIIKDLWTDRLALQICQFEDQEIDMNYKFPVYTGNKDIPNEDIKECSSGEKEIIDVVFRLIMGKYLGEITGVPMILDEVGVALDELHRGRWFGYISERHRMGKLPQTFMVSHYVNQYGMFDDSVNTIALNVEGLSVPKIINQHSVIV